MTLLLGEGFTLGEAEAFLIVAHTCQQLWRDFEDDLVNVHGRSSEEARRLCDCFHPPQVEKIEGSGGDD